MQCLFKGGFVRGNTAWDIQTHGCMTFSLLLPYSAKCLWATEKRLFMVLISQIESQWGVIRHSTHVKYAMCKFLLNKFCECIQIHKIGENLTLWTFCAIWYEFESGYTYYHVCVCVPVRWAIQLPASCTPLSLLINILVWRVHSLLSLTSAEGGPVV